MIEIPEETIFTDITDVLMNKLPRYLLMFEEQVQMNWPLQPFRYVGIPEQKPNGLGLPFAFIEINEGDLSEKDRIIKVLTFCVEIKLELLHKDHFGRYLYCIKQAFYEFLDQYRFVSVLTEPCNGKIHIKMRFG